MSLRGGKIKICTIHHISFAIICWLDIFFPNCSVYSWNKLWICPLHILNKLLEIMAQIVLALSSTSLCYSNSSPSCFHVVKYSCHFKHSAETRLESNSWLEIFLLTFCVHVLNAYWANWNPRIIKNMSSRISELCLLCRIETLLIKSFVHIKCIKLITKKPNRYCTRKTKKHIHSNSSPYS